MQSITTLKFLLDGCFVRVLRGIILELSYRPYTDVSVDYVLGVFHLDRDCNIRSCVFDLHLIYIKVVKMGLFGKNRNNQTMVYDYDAMMQDRSNMVNEKIINKKHKNGDYFIPLIEARGLGKHDAFGRKY